MCNMQCLTHRDTHYTVSYRVVYVAVSAGGSPSVKVAPPRALHSRPASAHSRGRRCTAVHSALSFSTAPRDKYLLRCTKNQLALYLLTAANVTLLSFLEGLCQSVGGVEPIFFYPLSSLCFDVNPARGGARYPVNQLG